jgi:LmeA-like phospholipid-binding
MGTASRIGAGLAAAVVLILIVAQLFLPRIAAHILSSRIGRYGSVASVDVSAWPAIKLLWGSVDSVRVTAHSLDLSPAQSAGLLSEAHGTADVDVSVESVREGPLRLSHARLRKRGGQLTAEATMTAEDVKAALPAGFGVQLLGSERGEVEVRASGGLFGIGASVNAVASASEGRLVARPRGLLFEGFQLTLFDDPRIHVEGVGASIASEQPLVYRLTMSATLR